MIKKLTRKEVIVIVNEAHTKALELAGGHGPGVPEVIISDRTKPGGGRAVGTFSRGEFTACKILLNRYQLSRHWKQVIYHEVAHLFTPGDHHGGAFKAFLESMTGRSEALNRTYDVSELERRLLKSAKELGL